MAAEGRSSPTQPVAPAMPAPAIEDTRLASHRVGRRADGFQRAYRVQAQHPTSVRFYSICSFIRMNSAMAAAEAVGFVYSAKWCPSIIRT